MSDIVKELRASVNLDAVHGDPQERMVCANQMARAADEIERLRARVAELEGARILTDEDVQAIAAAVVKVFDDREDQGAELPEIRTCDVADCECMVMPDFWTATLANDELTQVANEQQGSVPWCDVDIVSEG